MLQLFVYRNRNPMLYDYSDQTLKSWEGEELEEYRVKCNALNNRKGIVTLFTDSAWLLSSKGMDPILQSLYERLVVIKVIAISEIFRKVLCDNSI